MGTVHTRVWLPQIPSTVLMMKQCACGETKPIPASVSTGSETPQQVTVRPDPSPSVTPVQSLLAESVETRKGVPGSRPTFPHGFKDVHDKAAADSTEVGSKGAEGREPS